MTTMQLDERNGGLQNGVLIVAVSLTAIGLVMVASATASPQRAVFGPGLWDGFFGRQLLFAGCGILLLLLSARASLPFLASPVWRHRLAWMMFALAVLGLLGAFLPGLADPRRGSHRWLSLSFLGMNTGLQPSEFAKPALVLLVASLLTWHDIDPRSFGRALLPASLAIGFCVLLVGTEDFGTCSLLAGTGALMLFAGGCRWRYLLAIGGMGAVGMVALIFGEEYRLARITAFFDIWRDTQGDGYQPLQSLTTIASGGWWGRGLGAGVQKYGYLPESHTDFIFAVICEEMGVVGAFLVLALFGSLLWLGIRIMRAATTRFEALLAFGLTVSIALQALLNMAVVTVITPTTGISLPFISAGGSGLLASSLSLGLLVGVAIRGKATIQPAADDSTIHFGGSPASTGSQKMECTAC